MKNFNFYFTNSFLLIILLINDFQDFMLNFLSHLKSDSVDPASVHPLLDAGLHPPDLVQLVLVHVPQVLDDLQHQLRALGYPVHPVLGQRVRHVVADELCTTVDQHLFGEDFDNSV